MDRDSGSDSGTIYLRRVSMVFNTWRPLHAARCAVLHDLDTAVSGRFCRSRSARPPPPLTSRAHRGFRPHRRPLRVCCARLHFADRGPSSRRGEAHLFWEREAAGSGSLGGSFFLVDRGRRGAGARGSVRVRFRVRWAAGLRWGPRSARPTTGLVARMCVCAFVGRDGCQGCL